MKAIPKALSISCGLLALALVVIGASTWIWFRRTMSEIEQPAKAEREAGRSEGRNMDEEGCLVAAIARMRELHDNSIGPNVLSNVRLGGCLETSQPSEAFCVGVPRSALNRENMGWIIARCRVLPGSTGCSSMFQRVQSYCYSEDRKRKLAPQRSSKP
jgi:hypothetical protein